MAEEKPPRLNLGEEGRGRAGSRPMQSPRQRELLGLSNVPKGEALSLLALFKEEEGKKEEEKKAEGKKKKGKIKSTRDGKKKGEGKPSKEAEEEKKPKRKKSKAEPLSAGVDGLQESVDRVIGEYEVQVSVIEAAIEMERMNVRTTQEELIKGLEEEKVELEEGRRKLEEEVKVLQQEIESYQSCAKEGVAEEVERLVGEVARLEEGVKVKDGEIVRLEGEVTQLKGKVEEMEESLVTMEIALLEAKEEKEEEVGEEEEDLPTLKRKLNAALAAQQEAEAGMEEALHELAEERLKIHDDAGPGVDSQALLTMVSSLQVQLTAAQEEARASPKALQLEKELEEKHAAWKAEKEARAMAEVLLKEEKEKDRTQEALLERRIRDYEIQVDELQEKLKQASVEAALGGSREGAERMVEALVVEKAEVEERLRGKEGQVRELRLALNALKEEHGAVVLKRDSLQGADDKVSELANQVSSLQAEVSSVRAEKRAVDGRVKKLKEEIADAEVALSSNERAMKRGEREVKRLKDMLEDEEASCKKQRDMNRELRSTYEEKVAGLERSNADLQREVRQLKRKLL